jgi:hypothetical protein
MQSVIQRLLPVAVAGPDRLICKEKFPWVLII